MYQQALHIIETLQNAGFTAYFAGGSVRDMLMGRIANDYDIATDARTEDIKKLFEKTFVIGENFGVTLVHIDDFDFEVATFRTEEEYLDGRRPSKVNFCKPEEDAFRRDFTINGIFYDPLKDKYIDYVEGQKDINESLIRFIGNPEERIKEDHLRIIRAVRFKNLLQFQYDPETYKALKENHQLISKVSGERLRDELNKMITSDYFMDCIRDMGDIGLLNEILPEMQNMHGIAQPHEYHHEGDVWTHSLRSFKALKKEAGLCLKWAAILHDIGKTVTYEYRTENLELRTKNNRLSSQFLDLSSRIQFNKHAEKSEDLVKNILTRLKFSKKDMDHVIWLTSHHMMMEDLVKMPKGRQRKWFLHEYFPELLEIFRVDIAGTDPSEYVLYNKILSLYKDFNEHLEKEKPEMKLFLDGKEVMEILKLKPGPELGKILDKLKEKQLAHVIKSKEEALEWVKKIKIDL